MKRSAPSGRSYIVLVTLAVALFASSCGSQPTAPIDEPPAPQPSPTLADASATAHETDAVGEPALPAVKVSSPAWFDLAAALADRELLGAGYAKRGYEPPAGAHVLAARIVDGLDQPAFSYLSYGDTGFVNSDGSFWPASAVKLLAALGALHTLRRHGLTGDAVLTFEDHRGKFHKKAERLYCAALTWSSNLAYDRLLRVAGFDEINQRFLTEARGFRYAAFQRPFARGEDGPPLRESPEIRYTEGEKTGVIPARKGTSTVERCPQGDNCASLFELLDALSRIVLHKELPELARFDVAPIDIRRLKAFLTQSKCGFTESALAVLGENTRIYNKRGYSPSFDMIDHALIVDKKTGRRYLLAASVRYKERDKELAKAELAELGTQTLEVLRRHQPSGALLQRASGQAIELAAEALSPSEARLVASTGEDAAVTRIELWRGRELIAEQDGRRLEAAVPLPSRAEIFVLLAFLEGSLVGYKAAAVKGE
jgi:hypothetical protein